MQRGEIRWHRFAVTRRSLLAPQTGETFLLEPLGIHTQARAVPQQNLGPTAIAADEKVRVAIQLLPETLHKVGAAIRRRRLRQSNNRTYWQSSYQISCTNGIKTLLATRGKLT